MSQGFIQNIQSVFPSLEQTQHFTGGNYANDVCRVSNYPVIRRVAFSIHGCNLPELFIASE